MKRHTPEEIVRKLQQADAMKAEKKTTSDICRELGVSEGTYHSWRREYRGLQIDQAKRLKELEKENARLKKLVADQALDMSILKEVASGNL
ncbi:MAG: transposase [Planctomycetaceae bacterium]|nr:transposase [Planctomycetaceae bacterium]